ncbi:MAG: hypothetical protein IJS61_08280 [Firmicutes bacterium]|nr:hypothetical protein [Bacillota bacterium]
MILTENTETFNFEGALRGARNPMNSWGKSDSFTNEKGDFVIGENDLSLAKRLCKAGPDHRKFVRQIFVSLDITAPIYWWKEYDTYKVGTVANSTSTMHKIHSKPFERGDFSCEKMTAPALSCLDETIKVLEKLRLEYIESKDKELWYSIIQLLPSSYNQKRTCTFSYENAFAMYKARKEHKLEEWREFCEELKALPYFYEFFLEEI